MPIKKLVMLLLLIVIGMAGWTGYDYWDNTHVSVSTAAADESQKLGAGTQFFDENIKGIF